MIKKLLRLANKLDKIGQVFVADEVDMIIKISVELTPEKERKIEESWDRYRADPEKQEKNQIEQDYGLGVFSDDEDSFGLEATPWHGYKWSYEGLPKDKAGDFKKFERYQTVIENDSDTPEGGDMPETIQDPKEGGVWVREKTFDKPDGATKGKSQTVYRFIDPAKEQRKKEIWGDDEISPELEQLLQGDSEVETTELPEDVVEVKEGPSGGIGGVKLL